MDSRYDGRTDTTTVRVEAPLAVDRKQLVSELADAGMRPVSGERDAGFLSIVFDGKVDAIQVAEVVDAHQPADSVQIDAVVEKARAVWNGTDTFTQAQAQKILAGLVLVFAKRLR